MNHRALAPIVGTLILAGCRWFQPMPDGSAIDLREATKLGDAFMGDMISDRVAHGLTLMESGFADSIAPGEAERSMRQLFDYCGRPIDMEYKSTQVGFKWYPNGTKKPMRKLFYAATTTTEPKGVCFFGIEVVPEGSELRVTSFGPLKLQGGSLPDQLK